MKQLRRTKIISLAVLFLLFFSCQKELFDKVTIKGKIIDKASGLPLQIKISLFTTDRSSLSGRSSTTKFIGIAQTETASDGTFTLKSRASTTDSYFLWAYARGSFGCVYDHGRPDNGFFADENAVTDLGDIFIQY
jgi:hypothetical protein